ncbi:MAG: glycosyltransferase [Desulfobacteraceae bacterium]|nr:glycosyltransferase [Desulfobacteraceae bacterium]
MCMALPSVLMPGKEWISQLSLKNKIIVIVFLRAPEIGRVKTRLARDLGDEKTLVLYKKFVQTTLSAVEKSGMDHRICFFPAHGQSLVEDWLGKDHIYMFQAGDDLGYRMSNALSFVFGQGAQKAILIGTDIPDISADHLLEAQSRLNEKDVVIGPSLDGGYWLIGFQRNRFCLDLFSQIDWGTDSVFSTTIEKCKVAGLSTGILPTLQDIDTLEDLQSFQKNNPLFDFNP